MLITHTYFFRDPKPCCLAACYVYVFVFLFLRTRTQACRKIVSEALTVCVQFLFSFGSLQVFSGFRRFSEIVIKPGHIFEKMTWGRGTKKCLRFITPRTRIQNLYIIYVCMYEISFTFDTGRSFDWISLKLGRAVVCIEYWSCIVLGLIQPNEGGIRGHANSGIFRK